MAFHYIRIGENEWRIDYGININNNYIVQIENHMSTANCYEIICVIGVQSNVLSVCKYGLIAFHAVLGVANFKWPFAIVQYVHNKAHTPICTENT